MKTPSVLRLAVRRFVAILLVSTALVWLGSEMANILLTEQFDQPPETTSLTIPYGTAVKVAAGLEEPLIPSGLTFVSGDTLVVYNDDLVAHEVGPLHIPSGASASMRMDDRGVFEYACSFCLSQYLGLTINEPTAGGARIIAVAYVAPTTAIIVFFYSLALYPLKPAADEEE